MDTHTDCAGQRPDQREQRRRQRARLRIIRERARTHEGLGCSRGGLTTEIHAVADLSARLLAAVVSPGQRADPRGFTPVLNRLRLPRRGPGRPRTRPDRVLGDKAYAARAIRAHLRRRDIRAAIPVKGNQAAARRTRGAAGGRPPVAYAQRNIIERALGRLKCHRALALRTDKRLFIYTGTVDVDTLGIWPQDLTRDPPGTA